MITSRISPEMIERSFGLVATVENRRVVLPLKAVECEFSVAAGLVEVTVTQVFRQENPKPLDCDYLFPLPADASVYCCEADFNGRIIRAVVKERGEAVRLAEEKKAEGRRVALVESERENLFTLALKNLQPDDLVLVTLKYIQPLRQLADLPSVEIPLCPGIRYIPGNPLIRTNRGKGVADDTDQVPDASRISPVRLDKEHPDAAFVEIRGRLDGKFVEAAAIQSPSHNIISRPESEVIHIRLSDKGEVPDRDFVLRWKENPANQLTTRAWLQAGGDEMYALMEIRAPKATGSAVPLDFYFLVDHSGSMAGVKWEKAALAVKTCVSNLTTNDRVMLTLFSNGVRDFAEQPLPPGSLRADVNFQKLEQNGPDGGTELGGALRHVLERAVTHSGTRPKTLILITDAQVGNDAGILKLMESAPEFSVHCIGIDNALNDALLLALARQQQGTFHSLNPADDVVKVVSNLAATLRHPVLQDLRLSEGWEPSVKFLPPLFSEQVFHVSARSSGQRPLSLQARNGEAHRAELPMTTQLAAGDAPSKHWGKNRIQTLISAGETASATELSVKFNLICPLTAFIAWDESEKVAVASHSLAQPVMQEAFAAQDVCGTVAFEALISREYKAVESKQHSPRINRDFFKGMTSHMTRAPRSQLGAGGITSEHIVEKIVEVSAGCFGSLPATPCPDPKERMRVFEAFFTQICQRASLREVDVAWRRILDWAFADPKDWEAKSIMVARLLLELNQMTNERMTAQVNLMQHLAGLDKKHGTTLLSTVQSLPPDVVLMQSEAKMLEFITTQYHGPLEREPIAAYFRVKDNMRQSLEAFARKNCKK